MAETVRLHEEADVLGRDESETRRALAAGQLRMITIKIRQADIEIRQSNGAKAAYYLNEAKNLLETIDMNSLNPEQRASIDNFRKILKMTPKQ